MSWRRIGRFVSVPVFACASLGLAPLAMAHPRAVPVTVVPVRPTPVYDSKAAILSQADGQQAGTLRWMDRGQLVMDPYEVAAGDAHLRLRWDTPVFAGSLRVSLDSLRPGADIRVAYDRRGHGRPEVVAVELLNPDEARVARRRDNADDCDDDHWRERHWQAGRVLLRDDRYLTFDPYQRSAGDSRLRFGARVPVMANGVRVSADVLTPGADVKVYYDGGRVVGVELLSRHDARDLRREYEWARR